MMKEDRKQKEGSKGEEEKRQSRGRKKTHDNRKKRDECNKVRKKQK